MSILIRTVSSDDFANWLPLWTGYNQFYQRNLSQDVTETTWQRFLDGREPMHALVASDQDRIVGFAHFLFHRSTSSLAPICYLQDLFTLNEYRNQGIGRLLIEEVYREAKEAGSSRVYWQTHETNVVAKKLYDKIAQASGFVIYRKIIDDKI